MSELLTMQDLANGHLDVKALGEAANGDENTIVTTRTGNTYPSVKKAIKTLFESGGLPATPFKTKALMTASSLPDGSYAVVTDDGGRSGLYFKEASGWVSSDYQKMIDVGYLRNSDVFMESDNLYNNNYYKSFLITLAGDVQYWTGVGTNNTFLVFIDIEPFADYTITKYEGGDYLRIATLSSLPDRGNTSFNESGIYKYLSNGSEEKTHTFNNSDGASYLAIGVSSTATPPADVKVSVTKTSSKVPFTPYKGNEFSNKMGAAVQSAVESTIFSRSKNIYPSDIVSNIVISGSTKNIIYEIQPNGKTGFMPIEANKTYTITLHNGGDYLRVAAINSLPPDDITQTNIKTLYTAILTKGTNGKASTTFTNTYDAKYLAINANASNGNGKTPDVTVIEGVESPNEPIPYSNTISDELEEAVRSIEGVDLFKTVEPVSRDVDRLEKSSFDINGNVIGSASFNQSNVVYRIPVYLGDIIHIDRFKDGVKTGDRFAISESYNTNKLVAHEDGVYQNTNLTMDNFYLKHNNSIDNYTYTVTDNRVKEIWVYASAASNPDFSFKFETIVKKPKSNNIILADGLTDRMADSFIKSDSLDISGSDIVKGLTESKKDFLVFQDIEDYYDYPFMNFVPLSELYAKYDALVSDFPDYVSMQSLWTDSDGNDIRLYKFTPKPIRGVDELYRHKRVLLISGMHGDEKAATISDSHLMDYIARKWMDSDVLSYLRFNVEFYVVPVVNTTGYVDNTRNNRDGINLNREFALDDNRPWDERSPEANIVNDIVNARDYDLCIDHHTDAWNPSSDSTAYSWIGSRNPYIISNFVSVMSKLRSHWSNVHPKVRGFPADTEMCFVSGAVRGSLGVYMVTKAPLALTLESMNDYYLKTGGFSSGYWTQVVSAEIVSNVLYTLLTRA